MDIRSQMELLKKDTNSNSKMLVTKRSEQNIKNDIVEKISEKLIQKIKTIIK